MPSVLQHHFNTHLRLLVALVAGLAAGFLLGSEAGTVARLLFGWNVGVALFLILTWRMVGRTSETQLCTRAAVEDEPRTIILAVMVALVLASLGGTVVEAQAARTASGWEAVFAIVLWISTVVLSWLCMHTLFALHYAHEFYGDKDSIAGPDGGLRFPKSPGQLGYAEFIYMAFCIGMTYQVSDMAAVNRKFRWLITIHAGLSFFYNTFIIALVVNFISGLGHSG